MEIIRVKQIQILALICSIVLLGSCGNHATYGNDMFDNKIDTAINNFVLRDTSCMRAIKVLKRNIIVDFYKGEGICFSNSNYTEFLYMAKEMGGYENQYCYFYLLDSVPPADEDKVIKLPDSNFVTSQGWHLGSTKEEFMKKTGGKKFEVNHINDETLYSYTDSTELYSCKYLFRKNRLCQIEFGYIW